MERRGFWCRLCPAALYTVWFLLRVQALAARHLDEEVFIPAAVCLLSSIWLLLALLRSFRDRHFFRCLLSLAYLTVGLWTLVVGLQTPCCTGG